MKVVLMQDSLMLKKKYIPIRRAREDRRRAVAAHFRTYLTKMISNRKRFTLIRLFYREISNSESDNSSIIFRD
jgi:hypothetical protein